MSYCVNVFLWPHWVCMGRGMVRGMLRSNAFVHTYTRSRRNIPINYLNEIDRYATLREHYPLALYCMVRGMVRGMLRSRNT